MNACCNVNKKKPLSHYEEILTFLDNDAVNPAGQYILYNISTIV